MIEQGLFKKYFVGRDGFYWWIGQIAPEKSWRDNKRGIPGDNNKKTPGFGERYKVRIMGHHTAVPSELSDDELPWASVMYPVTAGGGTGASSQTCNLRQGMFVFGFFMDGEDGQQPVIMGVIGTNSYTAVMKNIPDAKFIPFTGLSPENGDRVATYARSANDSKGEVAPTSSEVNGEPQENSQVNNSPEEQATEGKSAADSVSAEDKEEYIPVPKPAECSEIPLAGLQLSMANSIKDIEKLRGTLSDARLSATRGVPDLQGMILEKKTQMKEDISSALKWVFDEMIKKVSGLGNEINRLLQGIAGANENYAGQPGFVQTVNGFICAVKAVFQALIEYLGDLVDSIVDKVINVARCFVEDFIASILAQIDNLLTQFINTVFGAALDVIKGVIDVGDQALSIATDIISFVQDILSILDCEANDSCEAYRVDQWNILTGGQSDRKSLGSIVDKVKGFSDQFNQVFDFTNGISDVIENQFNFNLDSIFDKPDCEIGPLLCGPPSIAIFGGTGAGFAANPIISESGSIIGIDLVSMGSGYGDGSYAKIVDACGNGNGGVIIPFLGQFGDDIWDRLNGYEDGFGDRDDLVGQGQRGVLDSFWQNRRFELGSGSGGADGPSITSPAFAGLGSVFTGRIGPERLALGGDITGVTTAIFDPFVATRPIDEKIENQQSIFTGNITANSGRLNTGIGDTDDFGLGFSTSTLGIIPNRFTGGFLSTSIFDPQLAIRPGIDTTGLSTSIFDPQLVIRPGIDTTGLPTDSILNQGVIGFIIKDGGTDYLTKPDGSKGGMNRTWSRSDQTILKKIDGTWLQPLNPGTFLRLSKGDIIETPPGTKIVSEKSDDGTGGGEEIIGGTPYIVKNSGNITVPNPTKGTIKFDFPTSSDGTYPVILYLRAIYIDIPGASYKDGDEVIISPSKGAKAVIETSPSGGVYRIKVTETGEGFKEMPRVYIKSDTGIGSRLLPQLGVNRVEEDKIDADTVDKVVNVADTTGSIASSYRTSGGI
jgi:hypothetical protein